MRRWVLTGAIAILAPTPTAELAQGAVQPRTASRAYLQAFACRSSLDPSKRVVSVTAVMRPVTGTSGLRMRFQLLTDAGGHVAQVKGGDLGTWISPQPSTLGRDPNDVWIIRHPVKGLVVPADYHFKVSFRWLGQDHRTVATATRSSQTCRQLDLRPDLLVQSIKVDQIPGSATQDRYSAVVENEGLTAARSFTVRFSPADGGAAQTVTISRLAPQATQNESFIGPACSATVAPTVTADPLHQVNDLDLTNNSLTATCPAPTASSAGRLSRASNRG
jgi:CARDB